MGIMMQYFEYDLRYHDYLWKKVSNEAKHLSDIGITALWLPPAFKGAKGIYDSGYGAYDLYDLGEFYQKWTIPTKYGTKDEYLKAIEMLHNYHIDVYPDIVFNHKMGADNVNVVEGYPVKYNNRLEKIGKNRKLLVPTQFNYKNRNNVYSSFKWTGDHFNGVDYDFKSQKYNIYLLNGRQWSLYVDDENGNYDYLMGSNIDVNHKDVKEELIRFGNWYKDITKLDGFRLDALKHIDYMFYKDWLKLMRKDRDYFAVGEYWHGDVNVLIQYLEHVDYSMSLFDVPLHYRFYECSHHRETYDLRNLFKNTLVEQKSMNAVTFVDNHDTQPGQSLSSFVQKWFKPMAYACILLREAGYPCIFYGDYYGLIKGRYNGIQEIIDKLLYVRNHWTNGRQYDYLEDDYQLGWSRDSGLAVLFSIRKKGMKEMYVGERFSNVTFKDIFHPRNKVIIDKNGKGIFYVSKNQLSVYIPHFGQNVK